MDPIRYQQGELFVEDVPASRLAAEFGTPCYVYSRAAIEHAFRDFDEAFGAHPHMVCYAVKANSNIGVLALLAELGAGFDIVSGGELARVIAAGGDPARVVFSGVGKQAVEMREALSAGIACFNVESASELNKLARVAADMGKRAPVSIRVNPDVDANTHPYISTGLKENKFGVSVPVAKALYQHAASLGSIEIVGIDCHIGSQITSLAPYMAAVDRILALVDELADSGIELRHIDFGGGIGVRYRDEAVIDMGDYAASLLQSMGSRPQSLWFEPGRFIVANAGILLTRVETLKDNEGKHFAVVDAAMNDLLRPSLYGAWQEISPVTPREGATRNYDIVGPVCETGDFLGKDRELNLAEGDLLAVRSAGAYGFVMSSNYNSRGRPPEVMVGGSIARCIRQRESIEDQLRLECKFEPLADDS